MGAVQYSRSGCPDLDVYRSHLQSVSHSVGLLWPSMGCSSAATTFKRALKDSGTQGLEPAEECGTLQQTGQGRVEA
jgi:hypothetical protein